MILIASSILSDLKFSFRLCCYFHVTFWLQYLDINVTKCHNYLQFHFYILLVAFSSLFSFRLFSSKALNVVDWIASTLEKTFSAIDVSTKIKKTDLLKRPKARVPPSQEIYKYATEEKYHWKAYISCHRINFIYLRHPPSRTTYVILFYLGLNFFSLLHPLFTLWFQCKHTLLFTSYLLFLIFILLSLQFLSRAVLSVR